MGRDGARLLIREPVFEDALESCEAAIREEAGWSLAEELHAADAASRLDAVDVIQPALFAIEVGLAALWRSWGIEPDAVVGHSMGEVAAAHVAGALSLDDAVKVICRRSRLMRRTSGRGAMVAVALSPEQAERARAGYEDRVSVAVRNSPTSVALSGDPAALDEIGKRLAEENIFCRRVKTDVAFHSPQMDPLCAELRQALDGVRSGPSAVPLYSTVTGRARGELELDAAYWVRNLREPVMFADALQSALAEGFDTLVRDQPCHRAHPGDSGGHAERAAVPTALARALAGDSPLGSARRGRASGHAVLARRALHAWLPG